ncbi:YraN family protein [Dysgonomonas sp. Marseille-P4677]|uniref:YraN family protein n=1 Tax=Dysgonomonas sp. Marseille-P4677 TaxID=2364790 RepID=UPI0019144FE7|nr:YraN family protein [Dysgonomonas sp. Marseille-P4677]MBK5720233.1 YraN family protein [Dysgonomonas sp. Marseille-P4677]
MAEHNDIGKKGEDTAVDFLQKEGYQIIERNWINEKYEIDIIARNEEYIVFVEVKTRSSDRWGNPEEAVSNNKIKRIVAAADFYLKKYDIDMPARFDIISAIWTGKTFKIEHIDDAFLAPIN